MSTLIAVRALLFSGECFAASLLLFSFAWLASLFVKQASMRHFVWLTAFGVLLVLPVAALIVPPRITIARQAETAQPVPAYVEYSVPSSASVIVNAAPEPAAVPAPEPTTAATSAPTPTPSPSFHVGTREIAIGLFSLWLMGFCWAALRLAHGMIGLQLLKRRSRPHALAPADLPQLESRQRECELRLSSSEDGPMAWGIFRPVILLPKNSRAWPRERLQAVLLHELAHVRRRDCLSQSLSLLVCALYWPNPLMWTGARLLRREAEIAADDAVIVAGVKPSAYAGELLQLASEFRGKRALTGVAMAAPSSLETRVKSVLALNNLRTGVTFMDAFKIACLGVVATALLALARPDVVEAQDAVAPAPPQVGAPAELPPPDAIPTVPDAPPAPLAPRHHHVHGVQSAHVDAPDAPPAPPAPPVPEAMPAPPPPPPPPAVHAVPPVPPVPAVHASEDDEDADNDADDDHDNDNDATVNPGGDKVVKVRVWRDKNGHRHVARTVRVLSEADRARIHEDVARAHAEVARVQPEIEKAMAAVKVDEKVARAMREVEQRIRAEIDRAMAEARPEIRRTIAEAHISEKVMKALHDAQPKIDAAIRRANEAERSVRIERVERGPHVSVDADQDNDNDNDDDEKSDE